MAFCIVKGKEIRCIVMSENKVYFDKYDIMERYGCGLNKAIDIIRAVKIKCGEDKLGKGKILKSELEYWESYVYNAEKEKAAKSNSGINNLAEKENARKFMSVCYYGKRA